MTIQEAKIFGKNQLKSSPSALLDCDVFLQEILNCDKTTLLFKRETQLLPEQEKKFMSFLEKRKSGLPVAYIVGHKEFFGYEFYVCPNVLIPKPDTEILVEKAIFYAKEIIFGGKKQISNQKSAENYKNQQIESAKNQQKIKILDMCTGSGCVGISVLKFLSENCKIKLENLNLTLADISEKALTVAQKNTESLLRSEQKKCVSFVKTNLFENIKSNFNLILANPPYVPKSESLELLKDGRNEPLLALNGDVDIFGNSTGEENGLGIIKNLVPQAFSHLDFAGVFLCETGEYNALEAKNIFDSSGFSDTKIFCDLEGQLRVVFGRRN